MDLIEKVLNFFLPANFIEHSKLDAFFYARINIGSLLSLLLLTIPLIVFNHYIFEGPEYRSLTGFLVLLTSSVFLFLYYLFRLKILQNIKLFSFFQVFIYVALITFVVIQSGYFINSFFMWLIVILVTMNFCCGPRGTLLTLLLSLLSVVTCFLYLELGVFSFSHVPISSPPPYASRFFFTDLLAVFLYITLLNLYHINAKKHLNHVLELQKLDIEYQRNQQAEFIRSSTLGEMAAGLAHEINNPIFSTQGDVFSLSQMISSSEADKEKSLATLGRIEKKLLGISKIVQTVSTFAKDKKFKEKTILTLNEILDEALLFCQMKISDQGVDFVSEATNENFILKGNKIALAQVIINLINNSLDSLKNCEGQKKEIRIQTRRYGPVLEIALLDSGEGVSKEDEDQIFKTFYTTKDPYFGTGLGLSISRSIIKEHGGSLFYEKRQDKTGFIILLPLVSEAER